ncbi:MAG: hypothetical protein WCG93_12475 [Paludibacter sp.]
MKKNIILAALILSASALFSQTNLVIDGGFEAFTVGAKNYIVNSGGKVTGKSGKWQLAVSKGGCPDTCAKATSEIVSSVKKSGNNSMQIIIQKQTNRNDIKLLQTMVNVPGGVYEVSFWAKSDGANPIALDVLKATQPNSNNGAVPYTAGFTTSTDWQQFKFVVDLNGWTAEELAEMRVSIRPNNFKALPAGPYPKTFWIDDVVFELKK